MTNWMCDLRIVGYLDAVMMSRVRDVLGPECATTESSSTWIVTSVPDQSALLGVLEEVHGLGLSVRELHKVSEPILGIATHGGTPPVAEEDRHDPPATYMLHIVERVGPLMTAALADVQVTQILPQTQLIIVGPAPAWPERLLRLCRIGLEIERIDCRILDESAGSPAS